MNAKLLFNIILYTTVFGLVLIGCEKQPVVETISIEPGMYAIESNNEDISEQSLKPFGEALKNSSIVALGEDYHSSEGFYQLKSLLIKYLVINHGYRTILFEDNRISGQAVNNYIQNDIGTAESSVKELFEIWHSKAVLELIKWLRTYNIGHPEDKVSFFGFDVQQPEQDMSEIIQVLNDSLSRKQAVNLIDQITICQKFFSFEDAGKSTEKELNNCFMSISNIKNTMSKINIKQKNPDDINWLLNVTLPSFKRVIVDNTTDYYSSSPDGVSIFKNVKIQHRGIYTMRDTAMANNINHIIKRYGGNKYIIWAHNGHISYTSISESKMMGEHLKSTYSNKYFPIGFFASITGFNWSFAQKKLKESREQAKSNYQNLNDNICFDYSEIETSLQYKLSKYKKDIIFISPDSSIFKDKEEYEYYSNCMGFPKQMPKKLILSESFNALFYLKESKPMLRCCEE